MGDVGVRVCETFTLVEERLESFYDNPNAWWDYFRDMGRMVITAKGRKAKDSQDDGSQYVVVTEYGTSKYTLHIQ